MNGWRWMCRSVRYSLVLAFCVVWTSVSSAEQTPAGSLFETKVRQSTQPLIASSKYQIWIPRDAAKIRCLFVINMRGAGRHLFTQDPNWRKLAVRTQSAMMFCEFEAHRVRDNGYAASMLKACEQFSGELNRAELKDVPFVLWGHSMGGRVAQDFARFQPSRVLAFLIALRANPSDAEFMQEDAKVVKVPALYLMGANDKKPKDIREHFERARQLNAPRAWVWLPGQEHWPEGMDFRKNETNATQWNAWAATDVVIPWIEAMIQLRLPNSNDAVKRPVKLREIELSAGVLGDNQSGDFAAFESFKGMKATASWFPNDDVARAWARFSYGNDREFD